MDKKRLCAPFPPEVIRTRPGKNGKQLSYLPASAVIARLNEVCDAWSFTIESHQEWEGTEVIVLGKLVIGEVAKNAFGGAAVTKDREGNILSLADDLKAAASDSLKKCASLFGVGLELYGQARPSEVPPQPEPSARREREESPKDQLGGASVRQLTAIHAASRRRGLDRHGLAEFVAAQSGKRDVSHLSRQEASSLLDALNAPEPH